ncbi:hypothetical protein [Pseudomonas syringae]|uniref:hypothetical protein n=1 Tax=Pseudomonas syringae TaxID=317 RepID=UPI0012AEB976|nr:hypothetical protein [Pseudomonas syringae]
MFKLLRALKIFLCGALLCVPFALSVGLSNAGTVHVPSLFFVALFVIFVLGGYFGRYISWGWLLGSLLGGVVGFYGLLLLLAMFWSGMNYEQGIPFLFASASLGVVMGGYALSTLIKKCASR